MNFVRAFVVTLYRQPNLLFKALIAAQHAWQEFIPEFKFNLGFSGKLFKNGSEEEQKAARMLISELLFNLFLKNKLTSLNCF